VKKQSNKEGFILLPEFPGGKLALVQFIKAHLQYPQDALIQKVEGKVYLSFQVNNDGSVSKVKVRKGIGFGCDEEAIRLVSLLSFAPANNRKNKVSVMKNIHIDFKLPKESKSKEKPVTQTIKYSVKAPLPKIATPTPSTSQYNYTITFD
jgi:TonB family protein